MIYEDFSLKIEPKRGDVYPVIVLRSPAGEGRSSFKLPFDPDEIGDILFDLGQAVRGGGHSPLRDASPAATRTRPQQIGDQLFNALFSGPVRSLLDRSLGMIHGRQRGLRIKLHIDPEDPSLAQLASLPWEFLYRKETRDFLNLSRFTPILRYLDVQRPYTPLPLEPPLRILVVISDPADYVRLDLEAERAQIEASWAKPEGVQVEFMEQATILALQDRLAEQRYHVLHYMGHGDFDERTGQGVLVMEDNDGQGVMVDGSTLGVLLRDAPTMRLVFLNACESARVTKEKGLDPFAGVAAAMVMAGIPAVIAMQFPISDSVAITFSQKFYPLLARGYPVDAAVAEGRRAIRLAETGTMEWGTPVLFMRAPQGIIFQVSTAQREKVPLPLPDLPEEIDEALEQRLAELYTRGLSAFWLEEWEKAVRSFEAIVDVRPGYEDATNKLAQAKRQAKLHTLYAQAQTAEESGDWSGALAALEELTAEAPSFKETVEKLRIARKQKQLADLYAEARRLHQAQQWQAVVNVFGQIHAVEPDYPDPEGLLSAAEPEAAALRRQAELDAFYNRALKEMDTGHWQEARQLLAKMQELDPGFRETERLLARVEGEIEREETERQRQEQTATLYEQALGLAQARQWRQALAKTQEIQTLNPDFVDADGIAAKAREEVAREEKEARRQSELATLYAEAVRLLKAGQYQEALEKWGEVRARDPRYPDRQHVQTTAGQKLAALAEASPPKRVVPGWVWGGIAGIVVIVVLIGVLLATGVLSLHGRQTPVPPATSTSMAASTLALSPTLPATAPAAAETATPELVPTLSAERASAPTEESVSTPTEELVPTPTEEPVPTPTEASIPKPTKEPVPSPEVDVYVELSDPAGDWLPGATHLDSTDILAASAQYQATQDRIVFTMQLVGDLPRTLSDNERSRWVWLLDTDHNAVTGDPYNDIGVEYQVNLHIQWDGYYVDVRNPNGQWQEVNYAGTIHGDTVTVRIPLSYLGGATNFDWVVLVEPFLQSPGFDRFDIGPNTGHAQLPSGTGESAPKPTPEVFLYDDFGDPTSGWSVFDDELGGEVGYGDDAFRIAFSQPSDGFHAAWSPLQYADFTVETSFSVPEGPPVAGAGLTLRTVSDGWYLVWIYPESGEYLFTKDVDFPTELVGRTYSAMIQPDRKDGRLYLQLKVEAHGDTFEIWVTRPGGAYEHLATVVDAELERGYLGPSAPYPQEAFSAPIEILFDWIRVSP
jgi:outer membrane protein assembly factor BamD (BamD/ComL family)